MLKKQDLGINPYVANNGYRDQSLTGIGGPRVYGKKEGFKGGYLSKILLWHVANQMYVVINRKKTH